MDIVSKLKRKLAKVLAPKPNLSKLVGGGDINLIDVGSVGGLPEPWNLNTKQLGRLLNFEPNEKPIARNGSVTTYNTALWKSEVELPFYIYKGLDSTGSSLFEQNFEYVKSNWATLQSRGPEWLAKTWEERSALVREESLKCRALDMVLAEEFPAVDFHFLKIDAQGAEYEILQGADELLRSSCVGLHLELFTLPLYKGITLQDEVAAYLEERGFDLVKKFPAHGSFDSQNDCLFIHVDRNEEVKRLLKKTYQLD